MPNYRLLRPNVPLINNYAVGLGQRPSVAEQVVPVLPVDTEVGQYRVFRRIDSLTDDVADIRAPGVPSGAVEYSFGYAAYNAVERALHHFVTDEDADLLGRNLADRNATELVTDKSNLGYEKRVKALLTNPANHKTVKAAAGVGGWVDPNADIIGDLRVMKAGVRTQSGYEATDIVVPDNVVPYVLRNTELTQGTIFPIFTPQMQLETLLPARFAGLNVITPLLIQNTANIAQPATLSQLWDGNTVEVLYIDRTPGLDRPTWGLTFRVRTFGNGGQVIDSWHDMKRHGDYIEHRRKQDERLTFLEAGGILTGVV